MNQDELLKRLNGFEWNDFECKRAQRSVPEDAYKTVSAFANTSGGWLVFGVSEHDHQLQVTGVDETDKVLNDFLGVLRGGQKLNRVIAVETLKFELEGKHVFAFYVPPAMRSDKPIYLKGDPRQSYIRRGAGDPPDYVAFREAAINLLIHQDYGDHGRKASVKIFADRTVFWNPGDAFATEAELLDPTEKEVRNPTIVKAFRRIGLSDQAGTGIRAIFRNWHELGRFPPQLKNDSARKDFELVLHTESLVSPTMRRYLDQVGAGLSSEQADVLALALLQPANSLLSLTDIRRTAIVTTQQARQLAEHLVRQQLFEPVGDAHFLVREDLKHGFEKATEQVGTKPGPSQDQVGIKSGLSTEQLSLMSRMSGTHDIATLMEWTGRTNRSKFRQTVLTPLLTVGLVEMTIPDKPTSSKQRYSLTPQGKTLQAGATA